MNFISPKPKLEEILEPEFNRISGALELLLKREKSTDRERFEIRHELAGAASPIRLRIDQSPPPLDKIIELCGRAIERIEHFEKKRDGAPVQTVHSQDFRRLQAEYSDIFDDMRKKIQTNRSLLERTL